MYDVYVCMHTKDQHKYRQVLIHHAMPSGKRLISDGFAFAQDNDPKHTANTVKAYLERKEEKGEVKVMEWPSESQILILLNIYGILLK